MHPFTEEQGRAERMEAKLPFVKLDCAILNSSLWPDKDARDIFLTALLMAEPREVLDPLLQINAFDLEYSGWSIPPGWYGFIDAAGPGIANRAGVEWARAMPALTRLGSCEPESRSQEFGGRRLVRVNGGFIVLNFMSYREKDYGAAERMRRFRERKSRDSLLRNDVDSDAEAQLLHRKVTQAEAEAYKDIKNKGAEIPKSLDTPAFRELWDAYIEHRKSKRAKLTDRAIVLLFRKLEKWGVAAACLCLEDSISNGWTGVFEPKNGNHFITTPATLDKAIRYEA